LTRNRKIPDQLTVEFKEAQKMKSAFEDIPYSLGQTHVRRERQSMLNEPHIEPLTNFVQLRRSELGPGVGVPYFDPMDGGVEAKVLTVLETPGPKAVGTNFVSQNNPDPTAKNVFQALREEGIRREKVVLWNIVPWNLSTPFENQNAHDQEVWRGLPYLKRVIRLLPRLTDIVLCGGKAGIVRHELESSNTVRIWSIPHFSRQAYGNRGYPHLRAKCHSTLREISARMASAI
jgi:hypothetical protein